MPIYEYECESCKKVFEAIQSITDKPLKSCKFCDGPVHRLISQSSFSLKGGGWYKDGYSKPSPQPTAKKNEKKAPEAKGPTKKDKPGSGAASQ